jgi:hypothetical protein
MKYRSNVAALLLLGALPIFLTIVEAPTVIATGSVPRPTGTIHSSLDLTAGNDTSSELDQVSNAPSMGAVKPKVSTLSAIQAYIAQKNWDVRTATRIARCESGFNEHALGDWNKGVATSVGIFQIHWSVHPQFDRKRLFLYKYNIDAAYTLYLSTGGFKGPWLAEYLVGPDGMNKLQRLAKTGHC